MHDWEIGREQDASLAGLVEMGPQVAGRNTTQETFFLHS